MKCLYLLFAFVAIATANTLREEVVCVDHPGCPVPDKENVTHLPYEEDCHKFYKCTNGKGCILSCPTYNAGKRLVFNPESQTCDWPWEVPDAKNCDNSPSPSPTPSSPTPSSPTASPTPSPTPSPSTPSSTPSSSTPSSTPSSSTPSSTPSSSTPSSTPSSSTPSSTPSSPTPSSTTPSSTTPSTTTPQPNPPIDGCPSTGDKKIRDPKNCNYYYECHNGVPTHRKCYDNTVFNPAVEACDEASNVHCTTD